MPAVDTAALATLLAPVPGDSPAGRDLRYDPRYDAVREARREEVDLPQGGLATERKLADWPRTLKEAGVLLAEDSKDLQLAAWYAEAALKRQGLAGLATGFELLRGLLETYWDGLYPELDDGDPELRLGALEWVGSRLNVPVLQVAVARDGLSYLDHVNSRGVPTEQEAGDSRDKRVLREERLGEGKIAPEVADASVEATPKAFYKDLAAAARLASASLDALERLSDERFPDEPPSYRGVRGALEEVQRFADATLARKLDSDPDPVEEAPAVGDAGADGAADTAAGGDGAGGTLSAEPASRADATSRIAAAARFLRQQDATTPAPFLLLRGLRWGELRAGPGPLDPTLLEAPPTQTRTRLKGMLLEGRWPELLEQCEQVMATPAGRGWLDLQRYVLTACARLGPDYDAIAAAVRAELAALLAAVPRLPEMTLMDDTPTANGETLDWLDAERLTGADAPEPPVEERDSTLPDGTDALADALDGESEGDALAAHARGTAARRRSGGRRRTDAHGRAAGDGADPFQRARAELARGRTNRAVELLVAELDRERSARGRFVRQTQIAQIMIEAGLAAVARPILQRLVQTIEDRTLEEWEAGPLVAQPMVLMCRVIDALELDGDERDELYLKVCRLDPLQAMALRRGA